MRRQADTHNRFVVLRGLERSPLADETCGILILEPVGALNTGEAPAIPGWPQKNRTSVLARPTGVGRADDIYTHIPVEGVGDA